MKIRIGLILGILCSAIHCVSPALAERVSTPPKLPRLVGIVLNKSSPSEVILELHGSDDQGVYREGERVSSDLVVARISSKAVELRGQNGKVFTLSFSGGKYGTAGGTFFDTASKSPLKIISVEPSLPVSKMREVGKRAQEKHPGQLIVVRNEYDILVNKIGLSALYSDQGASEADIKRDFSEVADGAGEPGGLRVVKPPSSTALSLVGILPGDVITRVNGHQIDSGSDLSGALRDQAQGRILVSFTRGTRLYSMAIETFDE